MSDNISSVDTPAEPTPEPVAADEVAEAPEVVEVPKLSHTEAIKIATDITDKLDVLQLGEEPGNLPFKAVDAMLPQIEQLIEAKRLSSLAGELVQEGANNAEIVAYLEGMATSPISDGTGKNVEKKNRIKRAARKIMPLVDKAWDDQHGYGDDGFEAEERANDEYDAKKKANNAA